MKHINSTYSTSMNDAANAVTRVVPSGKAVLAPFAALLITALSLGAGGCSKSKNHETSNQNQSIPQSVSNQSLAASTAPSLTAVAATQPKSEERKLVKGPVKRLASVRTYRDADSGVSFLYPRKATLKAGEKAEQDSTTQERLPMSYVGPGGSILASVELPSSNKDESGDLFLMNVNQELTAEQCGQFPVDSQNGSDEASISEASGEHEPMPTTGLRASFRGVEYSEFNKQTENGAIRYYHRFLPETSADKGSCYEFGMLAKLQSEQGVDTASMSERKDVFTKLEKILASVKIEPKKDRETLERAKSDTPAISDSATKKLNESTETAKAIAKDEAPR